MAIQNLDQDYTEIQEALNNALTPGLMYLLHSDDEYGSIIQNTASETSLKTFELPANSYTSILIEAEVKLTNGVSDTESYTHTFRLKMDTTVLKTFSVVTEESGLRTLFMSLKYNMDGGSDGTIGLFGEIDTADVGLSMQAISLRVYGVK